MIQYFKLITGENESAEEWMGHLGFTAKECEYETCDRWLKEQYISGIYDGDMMTKIIR